VSEQNRPLYADFIDLTKAFETVSRDDLWIVLTKVGCPERFVEMIQQFHEGMTAQSGSGDSLWAAHKHAKTEVLYQPCKLDSQPHTYVEMADLTLATVSRFTYFGSTVTTDAKLDAELQTRMAKASASFDRLNDGLYGETRMLPTKQNARSTEPWYYPHYYMAPKPGPFIKPRFTSSPHSCRHSRTSRPPVHIRYVDPEEPALGRTCCKDRRHPPSQTNTLLTTAVWGQE